jgi:hypothetical protein
MGFGKSLLELAARSMNYATDGFNVSKVNSYATIQGARAPSALNQNILGTRYALSNASQYPQVFRYVDPATTARSALNIKTPGGALGYAGVALNVGTGIYNNVQSGASAQKTVTDAAVDTAFGVGGIAASAAAGAAIGAAAGTIVPGAGNIVGAVAGLLVGVIIYVATEAVQINDKSVKDWTKEYANNAVGAVAGAWDPYAVWPGL